MAASGWFRGECKGVTVMSRRRWSFEHQALYHLLEIELLFFCFEKEDDLDRVYESVGTRAGIAALVIILCISQAFLHSTVRLPKRANTVNTVTTTCSTGKRKVGRKLRLKGSVSLPPDPMSQLLLRASDQSPCLVLLQKPRSA